MKTDRQYARMKRSKKSYKLLPEIKALCSVRGIVFKQCSRIHWQFKASGVILNYYPTTYTIMYQGKSKPQHISCNNEATGTKLLLSMLQASGRAL